MLAAAGDAAAALAGLGVVLYAGLAGEPALLAVGAGLLGLPTVLRCDAAARDGAQAVEVLHELHEYNDAHGRTFRR